MHRLARSGVVLTLALVAVVAIVITTTSSFAVTLAATTALIMGGSGIGNPTRLTDARILVPIPSAADVRGK